MWDGLLVLISLCIVMAATSFLVGMLPLYFSLSSRQLRFISALGTGILVGVALIIIIPEGVETIYTASEGGHNHGARAISPSRRSLSPTEMPPSSLMLDIRQRDEITAIPADTGLPDDSLFAHYSDYMAEGTIAQAMEQSEQQRQPQEEDGSNAGEVNDPPQESESPSHSPHTWVGLSLIVGFVLMYLIDTVPQQAISSRPERFHISLNNLRFNNRAASIPEDSENPPPPTPTASSHDSHSRPSSTTTGLVIHACADGIALGASSTTTSSLTFIIFVALIVHKAPAAFGLTSVLLKQGLSKRMARAHLIVFALAAPVGALITWAAAHLLGYTAAGQSESMTTEFATGVLLLFSGGTFLYVATHTMQDSGHEHGREAQMNGYRGVSMSDVYETSNTGALKNGKAKAKLSETGLTVLGMLLPLLFQFGHAH